MTDDSSCFHVACPPFYFTKGMVFEVVYPWYRQKPYDRALFYSVTHYFFVDMSTFNGNDLFFFLVRKHIKKMLCLVLDTIYYILGTISVYQGVTLEVCFIISCFYISKEIFLYMCQQYSRVQTKQILIDFVIKGFS